MNLKILKQEDDIFLLHWDPDPFCDRYIIQGLTNLFTYKTLKIIRDNKTTVKDSWGDLVGFRIAYCVDDYILKYSSITMIEKTATEVEEVEKDFSAIKMPGEGCAFSLPLSYDRNNYDLYRIYDDGKLIYETKDPVLIYHPFSRLVVYMYKDEKLVKIRRGQIILTPLPKERTPKLTVAIPIYNTGKPLIRTLAAVMLSSYEDLEILIIDDSTDKETSKICDWFAKDYSWVRVIHRPNRGGICSARNLALDKAQGEWFAFVDADDIVHPDMYFYLMLATKSYKTDIAIAKVIIHKDIDTSELYLGKNMNDSVEIQTYQEIMTKEKNPIMYFCAVWNKVVKTEIARKVRFPEDRPQFYEDMAYTPALYSYIDKFALVDDAYYYWDQRNRQTVGSCSDEVNHIPNNQAWQLYILAQTECFKQGNTDPGKREVYTKFVYDTLYDKYKEIENNSGLKELFIKMLKYAFKTYGYPTDHIGWVNDIKTSSIEPWDGEIFT